jgi:hypothetical protein
MGGSFQENLRFRAKTDQARLDFVWTDFGVPLAVLSRDRSNRRTIRETAADIGGVYCPALKNRVIEM